LFVSIRPLFEDVSVSRPHPMHCSHRSPGDDFYCLRYGVWYGSLDCAIRSRYQTCAGCLDCEQGRFNLKRHAATLGPASAEWQGLERG
jgi:hypothetical protein